MMHDADSRAPASQAEGVGHDSTFAWDRHLDQVADGVADGIVIFDSDCTIAHANPAAGRLPKEGSVVRVPSSFPTVPEVGGVW